MELAADWVVGFVDGEGCFYVGINPHPEMTVGHQVLPEFRIVQHERDLQVLHALKRFFRAGVVRRNHDDRFELRIKKIDALVEVVEFFEKHPLKTKKNADFKKFARIVRWMKEGLHTSPDGLKKIIETASTMNRGEKPRAEQVLKEIEEKAGQR